MVRLRHLRPGTDKPSHDKRGGRSSSEVKAKKGRTYCDMQAEPHILSPFCFPDPLCSQGAAGKIRHFISRGSHGERSVRPTYRSGLLSHAEGGFWEPFHAPKNKLKVAG